MSELADLYTTGEAADLVGVSSAAIRLWEAQGVLRAQRTARGMRLFLRVDLEALAERVKRTRRRDRGARRNLLEGR